MMYRIRGLIRDSKEKPFDWDNNVQKRVDDLKKELGSCLQSVMDDALRSKAPEDGQNLLTYAASQGTNDWFLYLAGEIRSTMGIRALVKELRELDIDNAPLLFNAAATRGKHSCFQTAHDLLLAVLGKGGLMEQVEAVDGLGRGLLMLAARGNHVETFKLAVELCKEGIKIMKLYGHADSSSTSVNGEKNKEWMDEIDMRMREDVDKMGMNCLHHAAEAGSYNVLLEVMKRCQWPKEDEEAKAEAKAEAKTEAEVKVKPTVKGKMYEPDNRGRTPIMLVLRNDTSFGAGAIVDGNYHLEAKFELLLRDDGGEHGRAGWMGPRAIPSPVLKSKTTCIARTELMYAARGGLTSLELALNKACGDGDLNLDRALSVELNGGSSQPDDNHDDDSLQKDDAAVAALWGRSLLLAAAAEGGDVHVLHHVLKAIENGHFVAEGNAGQVRLGKRNNVSDVPIGEDVKKAVEMIREHGQSVFAYTILSGRIDAVQLVYHLIVKLFNAESEKERRWDILTRNNHEISSLACAASASRESVNGRKIFDFVYSILEEEARLEPEKLRKEFLPGSSIQGVTKVSPLMGAAFSSNCELFCRVYDAYKKLPGQDWYLKEVWPKNPPARETAADSRKLYECNLDGIPKPISRGQWTIPAVMWRDIVEALNRAHLGYPHCRKEEVTDGQPGRPAPEDHLLSWREYLVDYSWQAVDVASKRGDFTDLRALVKEGFPLHDDHIATLLESIGGHEHFIIETVLFAVANASNPFGMAAGVSETLRRAAVDHPMYKSGLCRLQTRIDEFSRELLDKLPHTVRGMGTDLLGGHQPVLYGHGLQQGKVHRLSNLAGFIAAQWMLEPSLLVEELNKQRGYSGPTYQDPLQSALDRGSEALDFINSPLVLDYVHVKFTCTLPPWSSRNPFQPTVNEGFFKYKDFADYPLSKLLHGPAIEKPGEETRTLADKERFFSLSFLLRLLQGWDHTDSTEKRNVPKLWNQKDTYEKLWKVNFPHLTVLPGLQFTLAGVLGKPETFYQVPVIRFIFEFFSYLVMLALFCSSVLLKKHNFVPANEIIFYVFTAGMLWREILELRDAMPARRHPPEDPTTQEKSDATDPHSSSVAAVSRHPPEGDESTQGKSGTTDPRLSSISAGSRHLPEGDPITQGKSDTTDSHLRSVAAGSRHPPEEDESSPGKSGTTDSRFSSIAADSNFNQMVSTLRRYVFYDSWNFLESTTICCILLAFVFRIRALDEEGFLFYAQFFYALSAPLLFSKLLILSQIDAILGPMTQVIWRLLSHTLRFSAFIAMLMLSFALAFHALFHTCNPDVDVTVCDPEDIEGFPLYDAFGTFGVSLVTVFSSALGGPNFEVFNDAGKDCRCELPEGAGSAGAALMMMYMVTMSVVLLNLLIAVLSTAHDEVYANAEKEFNLARARLIVQSARSVARLRPPAPLNLVKVLLGVVVDTAVEIFWLLKCLCGARQDNFRPFSKTRQWKAIDMWIQSFMFAATMGAAALILSTALWILSMPWVAWCLLQRLKLQPTRDPNKGYFREPLGYCRGLLWMGIAFGVLVFATACASVFCFLYIIASVILWVSGIVHLGCWLNKEWQKENTELVPESMPGLDGGNHWENAWDLANLRNHGIREDCKHPHFNPVPFLKSKTGFDSSHLARLTKSRDEKLESERDLVEIDKELAHGPIDLEFLKWRAEKRINGPGLGNINLPLSEESVGALRGAAELAPFGHGAETKVDESVRQAWQIHGERIGLSAEFAEAIGKQHALKAATKLGLRAKALGVEARLYKLVVYENGGHFRPHKDTEKEVGMFGTLVVQLPTAQGHEGGALIVRHRSREKVFAWEDLNGSFARRQSGVGTGASQSLNRPEPLGIAAPVLPRDGRLGPHRQRLRRGQVHPAAGARVHIGLDFDGLKGPDRSMADSQRACRQINLYLATVVKHESGTAYMSYHDRWRRHHGSKRRKSTFWDLDDDEDDEEDEDEDGYGSDAEGKVMEYVNETSVVMEDLTGANGESMDLGIGRDVKHHEVLDCNSQDLGAQDGLDLLFPNGTEPNEREYEGYTGNCSPTLDFWYHRAVLVLWPASATMRVALQDFADTALSVARERSARYGAAGALPLADLACIVSLAEKGAGKKPEERFSYDAPTLKQAPGLRSGDVARAVSALVRVVGWPAVGEDVTRLVKACNLEQAGHVSALVEELSSLPLPQQQPGVEHDVWVEVEVKAEHQQQHGGVGVKTELQADQQQQQQEPSQGVVGVTEEVQRGQVQGTSDSAGLADSEHPPSTPAFPPRPASQQQPGAVVKAKAQAGQAAPIPKFGPSSSVGALMAGTYVYGITSNPGALERIDSNALAAIIRELLLDRDCFVNSSMTRGFQGLEASAVKTFAEDVLWLSDVLWLAARTRGAGGLEQRFTGAVLTSVRSRDLSLAEKGQQQLKAVLTSNAVQAAVRGGRGGTESSWWKTLVSERLRELGAHTPPVLCWRQPDAAFEGSRQVQQFLRGPASVLAYRGEDNTPFGRIAEARAFINRAPFGRIKAKAVARGSGRGAYVEITKTKEDHRESARTPRSRRK
eukprot:g13588.t2